MSQTEDDEVQAREWDELYHRLLNLLASHGVNNAFGEGDYYVVSDNYGWRRHHVEAHKWQVFRPDIVAAARALLDSFPQWQIVFQVGVEGAEDWPSMGLTIRRHEIIQVLDPKYLPDQVRLWRWAGGRRGTKYD